MVKLLVIAVLVATVVVHAVPAVGALGPRRLEALYGVPLDDSALALLLQHRAALFGVVAVVCATALAIPSWRDPALVLALLSTASFALLWLAVGRPGGVALARVAIVDAGLAAALAAALIGRLLQSGVNA